MDRTPPVGEVGERIAHYRRRRGLSQAKLAEQLDMSLSWVSQVERGAREVDKLSTLRELAATLDVPASEFVPEDLRPPVEREHPAAHALRFALTGQSALGAMLDATAPAGADVPLDELARRADQVWELVHAARYEELSDALPPLIPQAEDAARRATGPEQHEAFRCLAEVYQAVTEMMIKLGAADLAWLAADRSITAAERAGMPLLAAASHFRLARVFLGSRRLDQAWHAATVAADALQARLSDDRPPEYRSVLGALHLVAALTAARQGNAQAAHDQLHAAQRLAERLGEDRNDHHTEFGPANTALHSVHVAVELGDAGEALRRAAAIGDVRLSPERRARLLIDVARAHGQRRQTGAALQALQQAEDLAAEQVRSHGAVRTLVGDLLRDEQRRIPAELRSFAQRVGVLP